MISNFWWGYVHINTTIHVKRFFDHKDVYEARESEFVKKVFGPFRAKCREEALAEMDRRVNHEVV